MSRGVGVALLLALVTSLSGCEYMRLLRPSVLRQLNPDVVRLVDTRREVDHPDEAMIAPAVSKPHAGERPFATTLLL